MFFFSSNYTIGKPGSDLMKAYFSKMLNDLNKIQDTGHYCFLMQEQFCKILHDMFLIKIINKWL